MDKEKVKNYIKKNKIALATLAVTVMGYGAIVLLSIRKSKAVGITLPVVPVRMPSEREQLLSNVRLNTATITDVWEEDGCTNLILNDLKVSDLGKLGEELIDKIPDINRDTIVTSIMGLLD